MAWFQFILMQTTGFNCLTIFSYIKFLNFYAFIHIFIHFIATAIVTLGIVLIVERTTGLRAPDEAIDQGLDLASHGEAAYPTSS